MENIHFLSVFVLIPRSDFFCARIMNYTIELAHEHLLVVWSASSLGRTCSAQFT